MRRISAIALVIIMCFVFSACDSENMKDAKEAISNGDYKAAVEYLEKEEELNEKGASLLEEAKANVALEEKKYDEAILHIIKTDDVKESDLYATATKKLIDTGLKSGETDGVVAVVNEDDDFRQVVVKKVKTACSNLNYNGFKLLDRLRTSIKDKEIQEDLESYYEKNKLNKPKAFLLGNWRWDKGGKETETTVEVTTYKDELIGTVILVGDKEKEFQIKIDDVYWSDFEFSGENKFTCTSLCKNRDGLEVQCTTIGRIDYSKDTVKLHLTPPSPFTMDSDSSDRTLIKVYQQ